MGQIILILFQKFKISIGVVKVAQKWSNIKFFALQN